jgi:hypothetical protein
VVNEVPAGAAGNEFRKKTIGLAPAGAAEWIGLRDAAICRPAPSLERFESIALPQGGGHIGTVCPFFQA